MLPIHQQDQPSLTRITWNSPDHRETIAPKLERISQAYTSLEYLSVAAGLRQVSVVDVQPEALPARANQLAQLGLYLLPLQQRSGSTGFSHLALPAERGRPWAYYCVIARKMEDARLFAEANHSKSHVTMGELLGYPACCRAFFQKVWSEGYYDPIWQAAENSLLEGEEVLEHRKEFIRLNSFVETNPLLRYVQVRLIPHLPHSLSCTASRQLARDWIDLGRSEGMKEALGLALEMLAWPMEWSVLAGIAEVQTPYFKVITNSIPTPGKRTVQLIGRGSTDSLQR